MHICLLFCFRGRSERQGAFNCQNIGCQYRDDADAVGILDVAFSTIALSHRRQLRLEVHSLATGPSALVPLSLPRKQANLRDLRLQGCQGQVYISSSSYIHFMTGNNLVSSSVAQWPPYQAHKTTRANAEPLAKLLRLHTGT